MMSSSNRGSRTEPLSNSFPIQHSQIVSNSSNSLCVEYWWAHTFVLARDRASLRSVYVRVYLPYDTEPPIVRALDGRGEGAGGHVVVVNDEYGRVRYEALVFHRTTILLIVQLYYELLTSN